MIALILTIFCSTSIALILKYNDARKGDPLLLLAGNYFVAAIFGLIFVISDRDSTVSPETIIFAVLLAALFVASFFAFARAVGAAGTALATVSSRLSVIVPLLLSIVIFREQPTGYQISGILLALLTIVLFYFSLRQDGSKNLTFADYFYLLLVLIGIGLNDFGMKVFQQWRTPEEKPYFIFIIFLCAFVYSFALVLLKGIKFDRPVIIRGAILGIPNVFSTFFLLMALAQLPAIVVYPMINIGIIILTTLGAGLIWKEKLNRFGQWALISGIIAIVLLGM